ncbi:MAG: FHIPEP family type III secretion protein, partial [Lachnospiraceae bacterium]|nr:FHIPEP family type III secretion protein [Lachnospiraceae bacterium]
IFESLADHATATRDTDLLTEYVRQSLKRAISNKYFAGSNMVSVLTLDPERIRAMLDNLKKGISKLEEMGASPIVLTSPIVRMYFKKLTEDYYRDLVVVSYNEVESDVELQSVGMVSA